MFRASAGQGRWSLAQLLFVVLQHIELIVPAVVGQKLLMGALLQNLAVGEDDDVVRMLDGGQTVRHDEHGADSAHLFQRVLMSSSVSVSMLAVASSRIITLGLWMMVRAKLSSWR